MIDNDSSIPLSYYLRTQKHIMHVQKNGIFLIEKYSEKLEMEEEDQKQFLINLMKHDQTKFSPTQRLGYYLYFNAKPEERHAHQTGFDVAWENHYTRENHHPIGFVNGVCKNYLIAYEIACDLQAMSDEFSGSCRNYYEEKWKKENSKHVTDDCDWGMLQTWIENCISCFERSF